MPDAIVEDHPTSPRRRSSKPSDAKPWNRYEAALHRLRPEEREVVIARVELGQSYRRIAAGHGKASADAARMAVSRALVRLAMELRADAARVVENVAA